MKGYRLVKKKKKKKIAQRNIFVNIPAGFSYHSSGFFCLPGGQLTSSFRLRQGVLKSHWYTRNSNTTDVSDITLKKFGYESDRCNPLLILMRTSARNSRVTKPSYNTNLREMTSHFKLLTGNFLSKFFFRVINSTLFN